MDAVDTDLYRRTRALLEPGEVDLNGVVVHTDTDDDLAVQELTVELNDIVAAHSPHTDEGETYIHAGNDDPEFASNQFQGRRLDDDAFVWECQHLRRSGTLDIVCYYRADADHVGIVQAVEALGNDVTGVRTDGVATRDDAPT